MINIILAKDIFRDISELREAMLFSDSILRYLGSLSFVSLDISTLLFIMKIGR